MMETGVQQHSTPTGSNATSLIVDASASIVERISRIALMEPGHIAVADETSSLTCQQLDARSNQLARYLLTLGVRAEVCVGLLLDRSVDFIVSALAVLKAGGAYLPLDPATPPDRAALILTDAGAPLLISHRRKSVGLPAGTWRAVELDGADAAAIGSESSALATQDVPGDRLAYVIYTSGSTGQPKGVEITHGNLLNLIDWHQSAFNVTSADRASQLAGLGFDAAGWEIWPHLTCGASLHIANEMTRRSPRTLFEWLLAERITVSFVPTILAEQLLHFSWPADTRLRVLLTGADTLHRRPGAEIPFAFVNNYGPTECTVVATSGIVAPVVAPVTALHAESKGSPSIGRPIRNTIALILDDAMKPVAPGEAGELCLGGALVGRGYRNMPELTASRFVNIDTADGDPIRVYRTGDRARRLPDGEIAFLGRLDDQVKLRGYRIELGEIVSCLDRFPGIEASAVVVRDSPAGPSLVAFIVPARDGLPLDKDVRAFLSARLPDYMVPAQFVAISSLPLTPNGKFDKAALPLPDIDNLLNNGAATNAATLGLEAASPTENTLESRIEAIVAGLLNQPAVRHDDNFFMIGGHSMLGVQLVARLRDSFGVKLSLRQLFGAPTIKALAAEVSKMSAGLTKPAPGGQ